MDHGVLRLTPLSPCPEAGPDTTSDLSAGKTGSDFLVQITVGGPFFPNGQPAYEQVEPEEPSSFPFI